MSLIRTTNIEIEHTKVREPFSIGVLSDVHFSPAVTDEKLNDICDRLWKLEPYYILITGDLIDSVNMIYCELERQRLLKWLERLSQIAPVMISLGTHDYYKKDINSYCGWSCKYPEEFMEDVNSGTVHLLHNKSYNDGLVSFTGLTSPFEVSHPIIPPEKKFFYRNTKPEDTEVLLRYLQQPEIQDLTLGLNDNLFNVCMFHSPESLFDNNIREHFKGFQQIYCGHMHNGGVPFWLEWLFPRDMGLMAANKSFFPNHAKACIEDITSGVVVVGAVTTLAYCTGIARYANCIYSSDITMVSYSFGIPCINDVEMGLGSSVKSITTDYTYTSPRGRARARRR